MSYTTPDFADDAMDLLQADGYEVHEEADDDTRSDGGTAGHHWTLTRDGRRVATGPSFESEHQAWLDALAHRLRERASEAPPTPGSNTAPLTVRDLCLIEAGLLCLRHVIEQTNGDPPNDVHDALPAGIEHPSEEADKLLARLIEHKARAERFIVLEHELTDQAMSDLLTTAVESGTAAVRYWADITRILRDNPTDLNVVEFEAEVSEEGPVTVDHPDIPAAEVSRFVCDRQTMRDGIRRLLAPGANVHASIRNDVMLLCTDPEHAADADTADAVVQFAVFGELVFG